MVHHKEIILVKNEDIFVCFC